MNNEDIIFVGSIIWCFVAVLSHSGVGSDRSLAWMSKMIRKKSTHTIFNRERIWNE